jgi:hypothetical protein
MFENLSENFPRKIDIFLGANHEKPEGNMFKF